MESLESTATKYVLVAVSVRTCRKLIWKCGCRRLRISWFKRFVGVGERISTYFTRLFAGAECQLRFVLNDTPEATALRNDARVRGENLTKPNQTRVNYRSKLSR